jgi:hypothetical protein
MMASPPRGISVDAYGVVELPAELVIEAGANGGGGRALAQAVLDALEDQVVTVGQVEHRAVVVGELHALELVGALAPLVGAEGSGLGVDSGLVLGPEAGELVGPHLPDLRHRPGDPEAVHLGVASPRVLEPDPRVLRLVVRLDHNDGEAVAEVAVTAGDHALLEVRVRPVEQADVLLLRGPALRRLGRGRPGRAGQRRQRGDELRQVPARGVDEVRHDAAGQLGREQIREDLAHLAGADETDLLHAGVPLTRGGSQPLDATADVTHATAHGPPFRERSNRMARRVEVVLLCDAHGAEHEAVATIRASLNGTEKELDVCEEAEAEVQELIGSWLQLGRNPKGLAPARRASPRRRTEVVDADKPDPAKVRAWAKENGVTVNPRGRIPQAVLDEYAATA